MNNYTHYLSNILWYNINKNGYINRPLDNILAIYIYIIIFDNKEVYYIGYSIQLTFRMSSHRSCVFNNNKNHLLLYKFLLKYEWDNFKFEILEYINLKKIRKLKK